MIVLLQMKTHIHHIDTPHVSLLCVDLDACLLQLKTHIHRISHVLLLRVDLDACLLQMKTHNHHIFQLNFVLYLHILTIVIFFQFESALMK